MLAENNNNNRNNTLSAVRSDLKPLRLFRKAWREFLDSLFWDNDPHGGN